MINKLLNVLLIVGATAYVGLGVILLLTRMFFDSLFPCGDTVLSNIKSPDGLYSATLYERNCGATTGFSTLITVSNAGQMATPDDDDHVVFIASVPPVLRLRWESSTVLSIASPDGAPIPAREIFRQQKNWNRVQILYR